MSQQDQSYAQRSSPSVSGHSPTGGDTTRPKPEEWAHIKDPNERRKIQNKLAQRRFRDKVKEQKDESEREEENRRRAGSAYASPEPEEIDTNQNLSGLPWGGISMRYVVETGKIKEQASQQSSRENSVNAFMSQTGGSSRLGLCLTDHFARGLPAWKYLRHFPYNNAGR